MNDHPLLLPIAVICSILGLIACLILVSFNKRNRHANRMLALSLFGLTSVWLWDILYMTGWIMEVPHLHRLQHPLHWVVNPGAFLYVRATLRNEKGFLRYDWLLFLPFFLHTLELMPMYLSSAAYKRQLLESIAANPDLMAQLPEGVLPAYQHLVLKGSGGLLFMVFQWRLILRFVRQATGRSVQHRRALKTWLTGFTALLTLIHLATLLSVTVEFQSLEPYFVVRLFLGLLNFFILLFLLFRPDILYGLYPYAVPQDMARNGQAEETLVSDQPESKEHSSSILSEDQQELYAEHIERYINGERPYLRNGFSLNEMAEELDIPRHHLSACINDYYGVNFNDFVNKYRIRYLQEKIDPALWDRLTLEGIGREAGFNARSTFYNAFKKFAGMTPSEFRQKRKEQTF